jgi:hypothetical protein
MKPRTRGKESACQSKKLKKKPSHRPKNKKATLAYGHKKTPPKPIKDDELLYEVKRVLSARMGRNGPEYLVQWKGYSHDEDTWISELPSFFRKRCLMLIQKDEASGSVESDSSCSESESDSSCSESESDSNGSDISSDSGSDSESSSDSDSDSSSSSGEDSDSDE